MYVVSIQSMKYLPFISILILQWVVVRTDTHGSCLVGYDLLSTTRPLESPGSVMRADSDLHSILRVGSWRVKGEKSQLDHEHFFQAIRPSGNYHFYFASTAVMQISA